MKQPNSSNRSLWSALRIFVSLFLVAGLLWLLRVELKSALTIIFQMNQLWFMAALSLNLFIMILLSMRMRLVFEAAGVSVSLKEAVQLTFIGYFFNNFLPTSAGGDAIKAFYGMRLTKKSWESASAVLVDRVIGTYGLFLLASVGLIFAPFGTDVEGLRWPVIGLCILLTLGIFLLSPVINLARKIASALKWHWVTGKLDVLIPIARNFSIDKKYLLSAMTNSIFTKLLSVVAVYMLSIGINAFVPFGTLIWLVPIAFAVSLLPSINGLGFREGAFVLFLGPSTGNDAALALAALWLGVYLFTDVIGGLIYLFSGDLRRA